MSRVLISAAHKSSGKTTLSIGLCAALTARDYHVQPFKKGPDYIDPLWLSQAANTACFNLDFNTQTDDEIKQTFEQGSASDIRFVEGNKGLFDGVDPYGSDCNAALAKLLELPVILVVDVQGITRGIAPLLQGYQQFDPDINIAGVILNKVAGERHERKLRQAIQEYTDLQVLGAVRKHAELLIDERHLGLVPSNEHNYAPAKIETLRKHVEQQVDIDQLVKLLAIRKHAVTNNTAQAKFQYRYQVGIVQDPSFGFYYADDLNQFANLGVELIPVSLHDDSELPGIDGLFIGGGFPETHMEVLSRNESMRRSVYAAVEAGLPVYAECGGLMYLCRQINWQGQTWPMVGALPADVVMHERPQGRGYVKLVETAEHPWVAPSDRVVPAHEFHHSSLQNIGNEVQFAYDVVRGQGIGHAKDGIIYKHTLASYSHLRDTARKHWVAEFIDYIAKTKEET